MKAGGRHVSPAWIIRMDRSRVNPHAAPQCAPGARVGAVELRDCAHPVVWAPHSRDLSGPADGAVATVEQRLYEWCCDTSHKAGAKRQTLDVTTCFAPLLRWIVTLWTGTHL